MLSKEYQRTRIVEGKTGVATEAEIVSDLEEILAKTREKRRHKKSHGKIGFGDLARSIADIWKKIDPKTKAIFEHYADLDMTRYKRELKVWKERKDMEEESKTFAKHHEFMSRMNSSGDVGPNSFGSAAHTSASSSSIGRLTDSAHSAASSDAAGRGAGGAQSPGGMPPGDELHALRLGGSPNVRKQLHDFNSSFASLGSNASDPSHESESARRRGGTSASTSTSTLEALNREQQIIERQQQMLQQQSQRLMMMQQQAQHHQIMGTMRGGMMGGSTGMMGMGGGMMGGGTGMMGMGGGMTPIGAAGGMGMMGGVGGMGMMGMGGGGGGMTPQQQQMMRMMNTMTPLEQQQFLSMGMNQFRLQQQQEQEQSQSPSMIDRKQHPSNNTATNPAEFNSWDSAAGQSSASSLQLESLLGTTPGAGVATGVTGPAGTSLSQQVSDYSSTTAGAHSSNSTGMMSHSTASGFHNSHSSSHGGGLLRVSDNLGDTGQHNYNSFGDIRSAAARRQGGRGAGQTGHNSFGDIRSARRQGGL